MLFFFSSLSTSSALSLSPSPPLHACIQIKLGTPSPCTDVLGFIDVEGYPCSAEVGYDCWEYNSWWNLAAEDTREIIRHCPFSCSLCSNDNMFLELKDLSSPLSPLSSFLLTAASDFTGLGPPLSSSPNAAILQTACLPFQGCYQVRMTTTGGDPLFSELSRTAFTISLLSFVKLI